VDRGVRTVALDRAQVNFIDSSGLAVLFTGLKRLREHRGDLEFQSPARSSIEVLEVTGLFAIFAISL